MKEFRYSVYYRKNGLPLIVYATAEQAAEAMGISYKSFFRTVTRAAKGENKTWEIIREKEE